MLLRITLFCDVVLFQWVVGFRRFGATWCPETYRHLKVNILRCSERRSPIIRSGNVLRKETLKTTVAYKYSVLRCRFVSCERNTASTSAGGEETFDCREDTMNDRILYSLFFVENRAAI